jgi:hypothetical protein
VGWVLVSQPLCQARRCSLAYQRQVHVYTLRRVEEDDVRTRARAFSSCQQQASLAAVWSCSMTRWPAGRWEPPAARGAGSGASEERRQRLLARCGRPSRAPGRRWAGDTWWSRTTTKPAKSCCAAVLPLRLSPARSPKSHPLYPSSISTSFSIPNLSPTTSSISILYTPQS